MLEVKDLSCGYGDTEIVHDVSFSVAPGEFCCIIGSNGCGTTTTLKTVWGLMKPFKGQVLMDGGDTVKMSDGERARHFAYIPQVHTPPFPFTVADVVILGRTPYINRLAHVSDEDKEIAYAAMEQLSIDHLAHETYTQLSGGQQQLVLIARALAQQPQLLVMDEPTASLDFGNQQLVMQRTHELSRAGMSVLMVTHDPDHALFCADRVIVMEEGRIIANGTPEETITTPMLNRIYGGKVYVTDVIAPDGRPVRVCVPLM